jgi:hypothetical protein
MTATLRRFSGEGVPGGWERSTAGNARALAATELVFRKERRLNEGMEGNDEG